MFASGDAFTPVISDLNVLLKQLAEDLLPILGQKIRLGLFCASGTFPIHLQASQIEDILSCLFVHAHDEMQTGGRILLQTGRSEMLRHNPNLQGGATTHVVVTFKYLQPESGAEAKKYCSGSILEAIEDVLTLVERSGGLLSMDRSSSDTVIRMYFPVVRYFA